MKFTINFILYFTIFFIILLSMLLFQRSGITYGGLTYGGLTYGGLTYGGLTYGGLTYGGLTYGGLTFRTYVSLNSPRIGIPELIPNTGRASGVPPPVRSTNTSI